MGSSMSTLAVALGLGIWGASDFTPLRGPHYERPPGRPGIKKYRVKRRARNRVASKSRARNRA